MGLMLSVNNLGHSASLRGRPFLNDVRTNVCTPCLVRATIRVVIIIMQHYKTYGCLIKKKGSLGAQCNPCCQEECNPLQIKLYPKLLLNLYISSQSVC